MKFRFLCFGSHLSISLFIALLSLFLVFRIWYPAPLSDALGVTDIFILLLCIDVVIGPLLTLVVAQKGKKTLRMDLSIIAILQVAALAYGLYIVSQGRPVWLVYNSNRFEVVQAYEAELSSSVPVSFQRLSFLGPRWASINQGDLVNRKLEVYLHAEFLKPYDVAVAKIVGANALPLTVLQKFNSAQKVERILHAYPEANAFVPMGAKQKPLTVLVNKTSGHVVAIVNLSPW